ANQGNITIKAEDKSETDALAGGIALALGLAESGTGASVAAGAAVAVNLTDNHAWSTVDSSTLHADAGKVDMSAVSSAIISVFTRGVGVGGGESERGFGVPGAGSVPENDIKSSTKPQTKKTSATTTVTAGSGGVSLTADDKAKITADAGGVAIAGGL